jgi:hypothetical protein
MTELEDGFKTLHLASVLDIDKQVFSTIKKGIQCNKRDIHALGVSKTAQISNPIHSFRSNSLVPVNLNDKSSKTVQKLVSSPSDKSKAKPEFNQLISFKHRTKIPSPKSNYLQTKKTVRHQPLSRVHNFRELNFNLRERKQDSSFENLRPLEKEQHFEKIDTEFRGRFHKATDNPTDRIFLKKVHEFDIDKISQPSPEATRFNFTDRTDRRNRRSTHGLLLENKTKLVEDGRYDDIRPYTDTFRKRDQKKSSKKYKDIQEYEKVIPGGSLAASNKKTRLQLFIENQEKKSKKLADSFNESSAKENKEAVEKVKGGYKHPEEPIRRRSSALEKRIDKKLEELTARSQDNNKSSRKAHMTDKLLKTGPVKNHFLYQTYEKSPHPRSLSPYTPVKAANKVSNDSFMDLSFEATPVSKPSLPASESLACSPLLTQLFSSCAAYTVHESLTDRKLKRADSRLRESIQEVKSSINSHERLFRREYIDEVIQEFHKQSRVFLPRESLSRYQKGAVSSNSKYN